MNVFDMYGPKSAVRKAGSPHIENSDFLMHFGVKGMKWGVRQYVDENGQLTQLGKERYGKSLNRSRRGIQRDLNRMDREIARAQAKATGYQVKFDRKRSKQEYKAAKKGIEPKELSDRQEKIKKKSEDYQKLADRGRKFTEKIIADTTKSGKSIYSKDVKRSVNIGRNALKNIIGNILAPRGMDYYHSTKVVGTKYKVKNDDKGARAHKKRYDKNAIFNRTFVSSRRR